MQIMYVMTFLVTLFVVMLTQGRDTAEMAHQDSTAVAGHMAAWHGTAYKHCAANPCAGGLLDVRPRLQPMLRSAPAFAADRFVTRVDNVNGIVVTYMAPGMATRGTVSFGGVSSALYDLSGIRVESSAVGIWRSADRVVALGVTPPGAPRTLSLPSPFMGGTIPDGSPVLVGRL